MGETQKIIYVLKSEEVIKELSDESTVNRLRSNNFFGKKFVESELSDIAFLPDGHKSYICPEIGGNKYVLKESFFEEYKEPEKTPEELRYDAIAAMIKKKVDGQLVKTKQEAQKAYDLAIEKTIVARDELYLALEGGNRTVTIDKIVESLSNQIKELKDFGIAESISSMGDEDGVIIKVVMGPIKLQEVDEEDNKTYEYNLGKYNVYINLNDKNIRVYNEHLDPNEGYENDGIHNHPHVDYHGDVCWGESLRRVIDGLSDPYDIKGLIEATYTLLNNYNSGGAWRNVNDIYNDICDILSSDNELPERTLVSE